MKLKQIAENTAYVLALAGFLTTSGCGGEDATDPDDKNDPVNQTPPVPGEDGPPDSKEEGK